MGKKIPLFGAILQKSQELSLPEELNVPPDSGPGKTGFFT